MEQFPKLPLKGRLVVVAILCHSEKKDFTHLWAQLFNITELPKTPSNPASSIYSCFLFQVSILGHLVHG